MEKEKTHIIIFAEDPIQQQSKIHKINQISFTASEVTIESYNAQDNPDKLAAFGVMTFPTYIVPNKAWMVDPSITELEKILPRLRFLAQLFGKLVYQPCFMRHESSGEVYCANDDFEPVIPINLEGSSGKPFLGPGLCINAIEFSDDEQGSEICICPSTKKPLVLTGAPVTKEEYLTALDKMSLLQQSEWCSECLQKLLLEMRREKQEAERQKE